MSDFRIKEFANGLVLLGLEKPEFESVAMCISLCSGSAYDPQSLAGAASVGSEWLFRGAAGLNSRQLNDALDSLGCQHAESVSGESIAFSASMLGCNLDKIFDIYAGILTQSTLADESFDPCRMLVLQDLQSLEDEPSRKCTALLKEKFFPYPLGRLATGNTETLSAMTPAAAREHLRKCLSPRGTIIAVAGNFDFDGFAARVEEKLGGWNTQALPDVKLTAPAGGITHIEKDTAQMHISLAYKSVPVEDDMYYAARTGVAVLSMGMGSRLFTEVREKRGLVYHVSARYSSLRNYAGIFAYAGTRPEMAQQTYDVMTGELKRLVEGITDDELQIANTQLRSVLIMQSQSTIALAGMMAADWYHLRRLRTLDEISQKTLAVTCHDILQYLQKYPADNFTVFTIGPKSLDI
ncbi:MAG TPA: pitrilysin family protein [Phycisphaerae bacterium]|nr:pitrilysin family protein [Phycisphaerae bacterium]HPS53400.1 pitrilysin family protein [Phycisphaerae bacterium]